MTSLRDGAEALAHDLRAIAAVDYGESGDRVFEAAAAIDRVRELHCPVKVEFEEYSVCQECSPQTWPCATILALEAARDA